MARRSGFPARSRRTTAWGLGPQERDGNFSATGSALWSSGSQTTLGKVTIVRTRGIVHAVCNVADAAGAGFAGAHGIALVTTAAFDVGVTAVPTPITEQDWDGWLWHSFFDVRSVTATIADGVNGVSVNSLIEIDSKAMRKFDEDMTLVGVTEVVESTNAQLEVQADVRLLVKLG